MEKNQYIEIREIIQVLKKRWWIILVIPVLLSILAGVVSKFYLAEVYEANTTLYVTGKKVDGDGNSSSEYQSVLMAQYLVKDYRQLTKQRRITKQVITELNMEKELTASQLASMINVSLINDTSVLAIKVQHADPKKAAVIADKVAEVFSETVADIMKMDNIEIIDTAEVPTAPIKPKTTMNVAIAFLVGLMAAGGVVFLIEYMDNTIKTPDDVEKYLQLPVIGSIPVFDNVGFEKAK